MEKPLYAVYTALESKGYMPRYCERRTGSPFLVVTVDSDEGDKAIVKIRRLIKPFGCVAELAGFVHTDEDGHGTQDIYITIAATRIWESLVYRSRYSRVPETCLHLQAPTRKQAHALLQEIAIYAKSRAGEHALRALSGDFRTTLKPYPFKTGYAAQDGTWRDSDGHVYDRWRDRDTGQETIITQL